MNKKNGKIFSVLLVYSVVKIRTPEHLAQDYFF